MSPTIYSVKRFMVVSLAIMVMWIVREGTLLWHRSNICCAVPLKKFCTAKPEIIENLKAITEIQTYIHEEIVLYCHGKGQKVILSSGKSGCSLTKTKWKTLESSIFNLIRIKLNVKCNLFSWFSLSLYYVAVLHKWAEISERIQQWSDICFYIYTAALNDRLSDFNEKFKYV